MTVSNGRLVFVDVEARGASPVNGTMTEFGAVHYDTGQTFHGVLYKGTPDPDNPAIPIVGQRLGWEVEIAPVFSSWLHEVVNSQNPVMVSDNPAYDFMWIAGMFDLARVSNPFGHSARRISDFYAGLRGNWSKTQDWKKLRVTKHDHHPVHDAQGNVEAFRRIMNGER